MTPYSPMFHTLHDERAPLPGARLGCGTHYSVLRCISRVRVDPHHDNNVIAMRFALGAITRPEDLVHDFAVIWDEDHDTRVIVVAEMLARVGLIAQVLVIGESKGVVTLLTTKDARADLIWNTLNRINTHEEFGFRVGPYGVALATHHLIEDEPRRARRYLDGILALWSIGCER